MKDDEKDRCNVTLDGVMQSPGGPEEDPSNGFAELVDKYRIWVFPSVLGEGKRLFENGVPPRRLSVATRSTPRGVLLNIYRPAGLFPEA